METTTATSTSRARRRWPTVALTVAVVATLALAARRIDPSAIGHGLRHLALGPWLAAVAALVFLKLGAKTLRSHALVVAACRTADTTPPSWLATARLVLASYAVGMLAWPPLGFTLRGVGLHRAGLPVPAMLAVQLGERVAEAVAIAAMVGLALLAVPAAGELPLHRALVIAGVTVLAVAALAAGSRRARGWLRTLAIPRADLTRASAWAVASAVGELVVIALAARAAGLTLDPGTVLVTMIAINLGAALPVPGQLGVIEAAVALALATIAVPTTTAITVALAYRLAHLVALGALGLPLVPWALRATTAPGRR